MSLDRTDVVPLTELEAHAVTNRIRQCVTIAIAEIENAYAGRAWEAMGYDSWPAYCAAEFGEHISLPRDDRRAAVAQLRESGMSTRAIAAATGASHMTVARDLSGVTNETPADPATSDDAEIVEPARVVGVDGKSYPLPRPKPASAEESADERRLREAREAVERRARYLEGFCNSWVQLHTATTSDLRRWAVQERRVAAQDFSARSFACDGAEWAADEMDANGWATLAEVLPDEAAES